jgi:hypothetical protein
VDRFDRPRLGRSHPVLHLCEHLLNRIEIGRIGREEREFGAGVADRRADRPGAVASQVVEDDDVAWPQCRQQELFDVGAKDRSVDRAIDDARCGQSIEPEGCKKGQRVPASIGCKATRRAFLGPQPRIGAMLVLIQVSSMNTRRAGSRRRLARCQRSRRLTTSGRCCSTAKSVFFE